MPLGMPMIGHAQQFLKQAFFSSLIQVCGP